MSMRLSQSGSRRRHIGSWPDLAGTVVRQTWVLRAARVARFVTPLSVSRGHVLW
ncbi:hypothetical protein [Kibdelosporangium philippinense]|uniref:hypothetical protein n=1 Tax=Kibdelosporangium philippinense TaxID=211113 RepID=UPI003615E678